MDQDAKDTCPTSPVYQSQGPDPMGELDIFSDYCVDTMDPSSAEPMVAYIKRFQSRSRETGPAEPCKHATCSRTHPTNECCICRGPHFVYHCWHVLGLPDGITAIRDNFKKHAASDGPWKRQPPNNDRNRNHTTERGSPPERVRVSAVTFDDEPAQATSNQSRSYSTVLNQNSVSAIQTRSNRPPTTLAPLLSGSTTFNCNTSSNQSVEQEAIDAVQEDPLQGYRSPLVNHFIHVPPAVSSILDDSHRHSLPADGPKIDEKLLETLNSDQLVS
jgi:hypothetical protein